MEILTRTDAIPGLNSPYDTSSIWHELNPLHRPLAAPVEHHINHPRTPAKNDSAAHLLTPLTVSDSRQEREHICIKGSCGREDNVVGSRAEPGEDMSKFLQRLHPSLRGADLQQAVRDTLLYNKEYGNDLADGSNLGGHRVFLTSVTKYDPQHRPTSIESPDGKVTSIGYGQTGQVNNYAITDAAGRCIECADRGSDGHWTIYEPGGRKFPLADVVVDSKGDITATDMNGNKLAHLTRGDDLYTVYSHGQPVQTRVFRTDIDSDGRQHQVTEGYYSYVQDGSGLKCYMTYPDQPGKKYLLDSQNYADRECAAKGEPQLDLSPDQYVADTLQRRTLVSQALQMAGLSATPQNIADVELIVDHESSWNSNAINLTDCNAQEGHPSQGLMQTIPSTFQKYALPGYNTQITDPLSNLVAGIRYAVSRYGGLDQVPGVAAVHSGQDYVGY